MATTPTAPTGRIAMADDEREADCTIAKLCLGWKRFTFAPTLDRSKDRMCWWDTADHQFGPMSSKPGVVVEAPDDYTLYDDGLRYVPNFHADPAAVFGPGGLVESMAEKGWRLDMACPPAWPDSAVFTKSGCKSGRGDGDTPARAVARAALAAVKAEK